MSVVVWQAKAQLRAILTNVMFEVPRPYTLSCVRYLNPKP